MFRKGEWIIRILKHLSCPEISEERFTSDCHHKAPLDQSLLFFIQSKDVAEDREFLAVCSAGALNTPEPRIINMMTEDVEHLKF